MSTDKIRASTSVIDIAKLLSFRNKIVSMFQWVSQSFNDELWSSKWRTDRKTDIQLQNISNQTSTNQPGPTQKFMLLLACLFRRIILVSLSPSLAQMDIPVPSCKELNFYNFLKQFLLFYLNLRNLTLYGLPTLTPFLSHMHMGRKIHAHEHTLIQKYRHSVTHTYSNLRIQKKQCLLEHICELPSKAKIHKCTHAQNKVPNVSSQGCQFPSDWQIMT